MRTTSILITCCLLCIATMHANALTVEEILQLKQNGVSEQTIQMMLKSEIRATKKIQRGVELGVHTIVRSNGKKAILYSTGTGDTDNCDAKALHKEERAWEMLRQIIVDTRNGY